MILTRVLRDIWASRRAAEPPAPPRATRVSRESPAVLNVGGNNKAIPIPSHYEGWQHLLLDIDPAGAPDVCADARELDALPAAQFDAVYCSHNLEHYYRHDAVKVLRGFRHVLKPSGFAEIVVPDLAVLMRHVATTGMDIDDELYVSNAGPITVRDMIYGLGSQIETSGEDFFAHKNGFSPKSLKAFLLAAGFAPVLVREAPQFFEVRAYAFVNPPTLQQLQKLGLT